MVTKRQGPPPGKQKNSSTLLGSTQKEAMAGAVGAELQTDVPGAPDGPARPPRIPMNAGLNLTYPEKLMDKEHYHYRWFAEHPEHVGRIAKADAAYWEHVTDRNGVNITRPTGSGTFYLMRLPMEYHLEDVELHRKKSRRMMVKEAMIGEGEYAPGPGGRPEGGERAVTRSYNDVI